MRQDRNGCHWSSSLMASLMAADNLSPGIFDGHGISGACPAVIREAVLGIKRGADMKCISNEIRDAMNAAVLKSLYGGEYGMDGSVSANLYALVGRSSS